MPRAQTKAERRAKIARIKRFPALLRHEVRKAVNKNADELSEMIRYAAPEDDGDLKASVRWYENPNIAKISSIVSAGDETNDKSKTFYARMVEYGTRFQVAQPFFFPSVRALRRRMRGRITRAARKALKRTKQS